MTGLDETVTQATRPARRLAGRTSGLGGGITHVPDAPEVDPREAVLADPVVPPDRRRCSSCAGRVGTSRFGRPGRTRGYCVRCGTRFNFEPQLLPGDLLADQYEVVGCLAHGGQGWVYLAIDRHVQDRWVAIKGLLNIEDKGGVEAVRAELGFLARVTHPAIVKIYNFITHDGNNYIVMEYIGGRSLKQFIGSRGPGERRCQSSELDTTTGALMPVEHALAYAVEVLSALQYLHDLQLIYCDLKPDNIIHSGSYVRLIDLGAVRVAGDWTSPILGTPGFQAPEIPEVVPTIASDLYTVGRTLLLLTCDVPEFTRTPQLPSPESADSLRRFDSFHRLLARACHPDAGQRFGSAEEMRAQALAVLREVVAAKPRNHQPGELWAADSASISANFTAPPVVTPGGSWLELPTPLLDRDDPGAPLIGDLAGEEPHLRLRRLADGPRDSFDVLLEAIRAAVELADLKQAAHYLRRAELFAADDPDPLPHRLPWWQAVVAGVGGDIEQANRQFQQVYSQLPGELAPKLALGYALELAAEPGEAESLYRICLRTDTAYVPAAAFGLARLRRAAGDCHAARQVLDLVPASSSAHLLARQQVTQLLLSSAADLAAIDLALDIADSAGFGAHERAVVQVRAMRAGLDLILDGQPGEEATLRAGLERALCGLARLTPGRASRYALIDEANRVRPWTTR